MKKILKYTSRPTYIGYKKICKDYAAIHEIKPVLILNKPIFNGCTVLDLSKCMIFIMILLKIILMLNCDLPTRTVLLMK